MSVFRRFLRTRHGSVTIEAAVVAGFILLPLMAGIAEFARYARAVGGLNRTTADIARALAAGSPEETTAAEVEAAFSLAFPPETHTLAFAAACAVERPAEDGDEPSGGYHQAMPCNSSTTSGTMVRWHRVTIGTAYAPLFGARFFPVRTVKAETVVRL